MEQRTDWINQRLNQAVHDTQENRMFGYDTMNFLPDLYNDDTGVYLSESVVNQLDQAEDHAVKGVLGAGRSKEEIRKLKTGRYRVFPDEVLTMARDLASVNLHRHSDESPANAEEDDGIVLLNDRADLRDQYAVILGQMIVDNDPAIDSDYNFFFLTEEYEQFDPMNFEENAFVFDRDAGYDLTMDDGRFAIEFDDDLQLNGHDITSTKSCSYIGTCSGEGAMKKLQYNLEEYLEAQLGRHLLYKSTLETLQTRQDPDNQLDRDNTYDLETFVDRMKDPDEPTLRRAVDVMGEAPEETPESDDRVQPSPSP